jgi:hypothetical protein
MPLMQSITNKINSELFFIIVYLRPQIYMKYFILHTCGSEVSGISYCRRFKLMAIAAELRDSAALPHKEEPHFRIRKSHTSA